MTETEKKLKSNVRDISAFEAEIRYTETMIDRTKNPMNELQEILKQHFNH